MYLNPNWRVLTVGDGDLSFSHALLCDIKPAKLVASTYDCATTITSKYTDNALAALKAEHITVLNSFDVTNQEAWLRLNREQFDVVIFQFPLIPAFIGEAAFRDKTGSMNTLNRALLHQFIKYATDYALDSNGPMLCYITSKDVKPYREWNIEGSLNYGLSSRYLGQMPFDISHFPGYKIRNVDRDKHVKDTSGTTYVFSPKTMTELELDSILTMPRYLDADSCPLCRVGPFHAVEDKQKHLLAKKHQQMLTFEADWQAWLAQFDHQESL